MLDPPITQADVDAGTVFVRSDGSRATVRSNYPDLVYPWLANAGKGDYSVDEFGHIAKQVCIGILYPASPNHYV